MLCLYRLLCMHSGEAQPNDGKSERSEHGKSRRTIIPGRALVPWSHGQGNAHDQGIREESRRSH